MPCKHFWQLFFIMFINVWLACSYVRHVFAWCCWRADRGYQILWNSSYRLFWATLWVLEFRDFKNVISQLDFQKSVGKKKPYTLSKSHDNLNEGKFWLTYWKVFRTNVNPLLCELSTIVKHSRVILRVVHPLLIKYVLYIYSVTTSVVSSHYQLFWFL